MKWRKPTVPAKAERTVKTKWAVCAYPCLSSRLDEEESQTMRKLTDEEIQQVLEGAIQNIMAREGCDREAAMRSIEKNGVRVNVRLEDEEQTLFIQFPDETPGPTPGW